MDAMGYVIGFHTPLCCEPKGSSIRLQEILTACFETHVLFLGQPVS